MTTPFDPPMDVLQAEEARTSTVRWGVVLGTWGLSFAAIGTAVGVTLQLTGWGEGSAASIGVGSMAAGAALGASVLIAERTGAMRRPELLGPGGRGARPLHGAVLAIPLGVVAVPGLLCLAVVGTVALGSLVPALVFGMAALGALWGGLRVISQHRLARALEALHLGEEGTRPLEDVARTGWLAVQIRRAARVNLGMIALQEGRADDALTWLHGSWDGASAAWASLGQALAHLMRGDPPAVAEGHLHHAITAPGAAEIQAEAEAVRVLIVWRQDGPDEARLLAEQLYGPGASALHAALLGHLWAVAGIPGAEALLRADGVRALKATGMGRAIPELQSVAQGVAELPGGLRAGRVDDHEAVRGVHDHERGDSAIDEPAARSEPVDPELPP